MCVYIYISPDPSPCSVLQSFLLSFYKNKMRNCVTGNIMVKITVKNNLERGPGEEE